MNLHSFTDELLSLQAPSEGLGKVASNIRLYSRLGGGAAVAGALEHKLTKMKEEREGEQTGAVAQARVVAGDEERDEGSPGRGVNRPPRRS